MANNKRRRQRNQKRAATLPNHTRRVTPDPKLRLDSWSRADQSLENQILREAAMRKRLGGMTLGELPPELKEAATDPRFQPYRVTLLVQDNQFVIDPRPVTYFVRGPEPRQAIGHAIALWTKWEREAVGIPSHEPYPSVEGEQEAVIIDESDWKQYAKDARRHGRDVGMEMFLAGDPIHPSFWTVPGLVFDVPGYPTTDKNPHRNYPTTFTPISDDEHTPEWNFQP